MQVSSAPAVLVVLCVFVQAVQADYIDVVSNVVLLSYVGIWAIGYLGLLIFCIWKCIRRRDIISYSPIDSQPSDSYTVSVVPADGAKPEPYTPTQPGEYFPPSGVLPTDEQYDSPKHESAAGNVPSPYSPVLPADDKSTSVDVSADAPSGATPDEQRDAQLDATASAPSEHVGVATIAVPIPEVMTLPSSTSPSKISPPPSYDSIYT